MNTVLLLLCLTVVDERREILCLYDTTENRNAQLCETHLYAETVLNYLGLIPVYRDVNEPLPDDAVMERYRGVLTWFVDTRMKNTRAYWEWIGRQAEAGRKVVILGNLGATYEVPPEFINEGLRPLGLTYLGHETENSSEIELLKKGPDRGVRAQHRPGAALVRPRALGRDEPGLPPRAAQGHPGQRKRPGRAGAARRFRVGHDPL
jgi:hypothetical protein